MTRWMSGGYGLRHSDNDLCYHCHRPPRSHGGANHRGACPPKVPFAPEGGERQ